MLTGYQAADGQTPAPYFRAWQLALFSLLLSGGGVSATDPLVSMSPQ
jgi:hypothetical protein